MFKIRVTRTRSLFSQFSGITRTINIDLALKRSDTITYKSECLYYIRYMFVNVDCFTASPLTCQIAGETEIICIFKLLTDRALHHNIMLIRFPHSIRDAMEFYYLTT